METFSQLAVAAHLDADHAAAGAGANGGLLEFLLGLLELRLQGLGLPEHVRVHAPAAGGDAVAAGLLGLPEHSTAFGHGSPGARDRRGAAGVARRSSRL